MPESLNSYNPRRVAAIGTFDGVHTGHRSVLQVMKSIADESGLEPMAITFKNHPLKVIDPSRSPKQLTPLRKKKKLLEEAGAKTLVVDFDQNLRSTAALDWMKKIKKDFGVEVLVVGFDNTFGCDGVNLSIEDYKLLGEKTGITVISAPEVPGVSSSAIRKAVKEGEMEKARQMLGRPYSITSIVEKGNSLGHTIGFPTANIHIDDSVAVPKPGVYAAVVKTLHDGRKVPAMVNVGVRPTVMRGDDLVIETNLINWSGDLYGKEITIRFIKRLRDEQKFESIEALKAQLNKDRENVINLFDNIKI